MMKRPGTRLLTLLWILSLLLAACGPTPTPTPAPAPATVPPSPTIIPTPTMVRVSAAGPATLGNENWVDHQPGCGALPGDIVLGLDSQTCQPSAQPDKALIALPVETSAEALLVVSLHCDGDSACMQTIVPPQMGNEEAFFTVGINGLKLWASDCGADKICAADEPSGDIQVSYKVSKSDTYRLELAAAPGATWRISSIQAELQPLPAGDVIRGFGFSAYRDCQTPNGGPHPSQAELEEDLTLLPHVANAIRTYSSLDINVDIIHGALERGLLVAPGVSIGRDPEKNEREIEGVAALARDSHVKFIIVGNEVMLRGDQDAESLAAYMRQVKALTGLPVAYADIGSWFLQRGADGSWEPKTEWQPIIDAADILLVHIYPYWDGVSIDGSAAYVADVYDLLTNVFHDKRVIIGETGWPSRGEQRGQAVPNLENQRRFFYEFTAIADQRGIDYFYFAPFEEPWKTAEGTVGPSWGIVTAERMNKFGSGSLLATREFTPLPASASTTPGLGNPTPSAVPPSGSDGQGVPPPAVIYSDFPLGDLFVPSRYQGDWSDLHYDACSKTSPHSGRTDLRVEYTADGVGQPNGKGWAGILWDYPSQNMDDPNKSPDFNAYKNLSFYARGEQGGERVSFLLGGTQVGDFPSSVTQPLVLEVTLTTKWQQYAFDLSGVDLSRLTDGFGWAVSACHNPNGAVFHLDDIQLGTEVIPTAPPQELTVLDNGCLRAGLDLGIDTSKQERKWASQDDSALRLDYPARQQWGAAFIYVNQQVPSGKPSMDLSHYNVLAVEMRGAFGGEMVSIGIKDANDPDDGTEYKLNQRLTREWQTYYFDLADFNRFWYAELDKINVLAEFVFGGSSFTETIYIRSIQYLRR